MFKNYLKIAFRNLKRNKGYAFINIFGLAVGMACCLLIGLYVRQELSYDDFHKKAERIYRVTQSRPSGGLTHTGAAFAPALEQDFPQIKATVFIARQNELIANIDSTTGDVQRFEEENFFYVDANFFNVFSFPLVKGNPKTALARPGTVVLTKSVAKKYFGTANPLSMTLTLENYDIPLTVTGIVKLPENSHISFDLLTSFATFKQTVGMAVDAELQSYWWPWGWTYVLLEKGANAAKIEAQLPAFNKRRRPGVDEYQVHLQPITRIHLYSNFSDELKATGSIRMVYVFSAIALFVMLIACVNFVNLATARSMERSQEVAMRKTAGAHRGQIVRQFFGESLLLSGVSLFAAIILTELSLPLFNNIAGTSLHLHYEIGFLAALATIFMFVGLGAGIYPALVLSRFSPAKVFKSGFKRQGMGSGWLRKGLVVFQFVISVVLISATAIAFLQFNYMQTARLGFDENRVVVLSGDVSNNYIALKNELLQQPNIQAVSSTTVRPGMGEGLPTPFEVEGKSGFVDEEGEQKRIMPVQFVGFSYFDMMDIELLAGRGFAESRRADLGRALQDDNHAGLFFRERAKIINETAARKLGWTPQEAIGKTLRLYTQERGTYYIDTKGPIIGVVEDFHTASLRKKISPVAFEPAAIPGTNFYSAEYVLIKMAPGGNAESAAQTLRHVWERVLPQKPIEVSFLDETLNNLYEREQRISQIFGLFAGLAILIACLGLFGLAAYTAQRRTKEIGIRKVMGATVANIVGLLSKDFLKLVAIGFVIAVPIAWYAMNKWLADFAYRIDIGIGIFLLAGGLALLIALATVSWQSIRAALANPVDSLRSE